MQQQQKKTKPKKGYKKFAGTTKVNQTATSIAYQVGKHLERFFPVAKLMGAKNNLARFASGISRVAGFGDYTLSQGGSTEHIVSNSLIKGGPPKFGSENIRIKHREYITDVITSPTAGAFLGQVLYVNPGLSLSYPWLSQIAQNFESYRLIGQIYEFKTMSADALNSTNTALGQVIMSCQYDSTNLPFTAKQQQENYTNSISVKPSQSAMFPLECKPSQNVLKEMYIRGSNVPSGSSQQFYDMGQFQISTNGFQSTNVNVGELWVTYEYELLHPKIALTEDDYCHYTCAGSISNTNWFGNSQIAQSGTSLYLNFKTNSLVFPPSLVG